LRLTATTLAARHMVVRIRGWHCRLPLPPYEYPGEDTNKGRAADAAYNATDYGTHRRRSGPFVGYVHAVGFPWLKGRCWWVDGSCKE
jgi:hypothetical protein